MEPETSAPVQRSIFTDDNLEEIEPETSEPISIFTDRHLGEMEPFRIYLILLKKGWKFQIYHFREHWHLFYTIHDLLETLESNCSPASREAVELINCNVCACTEWNTVVYGYTAFLTELLQIGYPVNIVLDGQGNTMLHGAAKFGNSCTVSLLLDYEADVTAVTRRGHNKYPQFTPLHFAAAAAESRIRGWCYERIIKLLIEAGADIDARDGNGMTPLHHAVIKGNRSMVKFLLDMNCDKRIKDSLGNAAIDFAHEELKDLLSE